MYAAEMMGKRAVPKGPRGVHILFAAFIAFFMWAVSAHAATIEAVNYKMAGDATRMRVVINFDQEPDVKWFLLRGPHRLVIDLPETRVKFDSKDLKARGLIKMIRYGRLEGASTRLILSTKGPFNVEKLEIIENENSDGYRLVADIAAASEREFEEALAVQSQTTSSTVSADKHDRVGQPASPAARPFTIVIDPGHGGIDGGAEGRNGTVEKTITLAFGLELRKKLEAVGKYTVHMTRDGDQFLRLDDRVRIARQHDADLFISIHADTINVKGLRGATVYTVSDRASDAEAAATAIRENLSDQLAGIQIEDQNHEVADILVDLIRRETHGFSIKFARSLVTELAQSIGVINNPHRFAGFRVLKAPDVPSVLVELGYLSNPEDEELLRSSDWREKAADSIAKAIALFAAGKRGTSG